MKQVLASHRAFLVLMFIVPVLMHCDVCAQDKLLDILTEELNREMSVLKTQQVPPYFLSYRVDEIHTCYVSALSGALVASKSSDTRILDVSIRVGDYSMDNTRQIRGGYRMSFNSGGSSSDLIARENDPAAIKTTLWTKTNEAYREAVEMYANVKANTAVKVAAEDTSADFSREAGVVASYEPPLDIRALEGDIKAWEAKVKHYSALFLQSKDIYGGRVSFTYTVERKYFISSEGTRIVHNIPYARLMINGLAKADDGMELPLYKDYSAFKPSDLPGDDVILEDVRLMVKKLEALRKAPLVDPFAGPAILSGRASGVFFHEVFGHRVEGHRQKNENEGQTFKKKVNESVLPSHISVVFDPTRKQLNGCDLLGYYAYDDEGVLARPVEVVHNGIFKDFLMSRTPIERFSVSNGHGRATAGLTPVARQSNLLVNTSMPQTSAQLRQKLIDECRKQGKEFGLYFENIQGGYTMTGRRTPNAFNVTPLEVYRIYVDGRPDELVRGVDLIGTPLAMFATITDVGDSYDVFNGSCGAESGYIPVSASSPQILVSRIEVQKKAKSQDRPSVLPRPDTEDTQIPESKRTQNGKVTP